MKIITNNPLVQQEVHTIEVEFIDGSYKDVLMHTHKQVVENAYAVLTHPLSGSIKPNETLYKSVIIAPQKSSPIDMDSVNLLDSAIDVYDHFQTMRPTPNWPEKVKEDFAVVDFHILQGAISQIQVPPRYL